ncbi:Pimeloyl-ACP methyl ester carboxylesterase [Amycolatopsis xylanica]|uniref:Pimeloyl-ACP methyl ester carboxylesterase n=1 Tax=Amycolatopsis xylanica TaxID=589385 RepID=A0A1H3DTG7_9PSEU|nr:alpha/beta hydrolase [Amycolatopsis xylanica]SDX69705.1 Pimeloyl-ACP methyl ester carboxylesterase [Amycolatopsis xylanica]
MTTYVLIHGAGDVGWAWHLLEAELRGNGHDTVAPDLPIEDDSAGLADYVDSVVEAVGDRDGDVVVVGHSFGGIVAPLVAERLSAKVIVLLAGMIPAPGETTNDWWGNTGYSAASAKAAKQDGGLTGNPDPFVSFYNGVPRELAEQAMSKERGQSESAMNDPWPLKKWPDITTKFILATEDRFFPPAFFQKLVKERLNITPDEVAACHCAALSKPKEIAALLESYTD